MAHHYSIETSEKNILIVDDTLVNCKALSKILSDEGYQVHVAMDGNIAISICESILPDLVLLDVKMPGMDGYEVCEQLKATEKTKDVPIIFVSALSDVWDKVRAFNIGAVDYITRPFEREDVLCRVRNHLSLRSLQTELQKQNVSLQQEIKERQQVQTALELSETKNKALLNAIPDLMFRISAEGVFLDYRISHIDDEAVTKQSSVQNTSEISQSVIFPIPNTSNSENNFIGKKVVNLFSGDLAMWIMYYVEQTLQTSKIQIGEYMQQVSGKWHAYEVRYVRSGQNEVLTLVRDISERKQAEAERRQSEALLRSQKQQLEQALKELKTAQVQLIQNEKMFALGQLVAGIAHEINNPVNFISGNLKYAADYIQDLLTVIVTYQEEYPNPSPKIEEIIENVDLEFLVSDVKTLMDSMQKGAERIQKIVLSLRNFSRLDEAEMKEVNIHEGIDSTLVILQNRLRKTQNRPQIEVIRDYSELPKVTCYASQMNQVLMHLLTNAIDALDKNEANENDPPQISIRTELTPLETVKIFIADNGVGIPESVQARLFDPFFTTKPVGSGTGLGLSISYQIVVQKHRGQLICCSFPGQGSEFCIEIPVHQPDEKS